MQHDQIDDRFSRLTNLTHLDVQFVGITNESLIPLTNLTHLNLWWSDGADDDGIRGLTGLTYLGMGGPEGTFQCQSFTDRALVDLTNLRTLDISSNGGISIDGITHLTNLTYLDAYQSNLRKVDLDRLHFVEKISPTGIVFNRNIY